MTDEMLALPRKSAQGKVENVEFLKGEIEPYPRSLTSRWM